MTDRLKKWRDILTADPTETRQENLQSRAGNGHQRVSSRFCSTETRSLTLWGHDHQRVSSRLCSTESRFLTVWRQEMTIKGSVAGFSAKRPDDWLPEGMGWPPKGQQHFLQKRGQITHILRAWDGHQRVSSMFCSKETTSLTYWGQEMATKGSAACFAAKRPDYLPTEGRRWPPKVNSNFC